MEINRFNRLARILSVQATSYNQFRTFAYIIRQLKNMECDGVTFYVADGNIYATKGNADTYACVVSHMDTVHAISSDLTVVRIGDNLTGFNKHTMKQTGIGGDDKVGIFVCLEVLRNFDDIKVAFFRDEEVGCVGSYDADMGFFNDCRYVLQCDRRGNSDFITEASGVSLSSKKFQRDIAQIIAAYGYSTTSGMMTDVMALKENGLRCSCANISCGYYSPHTSYEYVSVSDVDNCLEMVMDIISTLSSKVYKHTFERSYSRFDTYTYRPHKKSSRTHGSAPDDFDFDWDINNRAKFDNCYECGMYEERTKLVYGLCSFCVKKYNYEGFNI